MNEEHVRLYAGLLIEAARMAAGPQLRVAADNLEAALEGRVGDLSVSDSTLRVGWGDGEFSRWNLEES